MDEISIISDEKEKYESELPELRQKLKTLKEENSSLTEQVHYTKQFCIISLSFTIA